MSELLPNLDAMRAQLTGAAASQLDALALADAIAHATTEKDLDGALETVIATWRQP